MTPPSCRHNRTAAMSQSRQGAKPIADCESLRQDQLATLRQPFASMQACIRRTDACVTKPSVPL